MFSGKQIIWRMTLLLRKEEVMEVWVNYKELCKKRSRAVSIKQRRKRKYRESPERYLQRESEYADAVCDHCYEHLCGYSGRVCSAYAVVPVCLIRIEAEGIACCLHDVPVWLHAIAGVAQIVAGVSPEQLFLWCFAW